MIDHTGVSVSDPAAARAHAPLGYRVLREIPTSVTGGKVVLGLGVPPKPDDGAFVLDPDGHNIEAVCHDPA